MMHTRALTVLALLLLPISAWGDERASAPVVNEVTTATLFAEQEFLVRGQDHWIGVQLDMPEGWHTYWMNPGDTGLAASIHAKDLPDGLHLGPIHWASPERIEIAGLVNFGYHDEAFLLLPLQVDAHSNASEVTLNLRAEWLVCKDICIPEAADLSLTLPIQESGEVVSSPRFRRAVAALPTPLAGARYRVHDAHVILALPFEDATLAFYPETETMVGITNLPEMRVQDGQTLLRFAAGVQPSRDGFKGIVVRSDGTVHRITASHDAMLAFDSPVTATADAASSTDTGMGLPLALLLAFLGGLVLNAMPCVLPVLSLKVLGLVKKAGISRRAAAMQGLAYTAGVLASFLLVAGILLVLRQGGTALGWGYQLQSPAFVMGLAAIIFLVGLNLSGVFSIPGLIGTWGQHSAAQETLLGSFLTGALATLVATPCTAPFMASAIGFALALPPMAALSVFLMLGLGLAAPYLLISLFPTLRHWLPRPGAWMETFRQFLAFPMYATTAWLLWVLSTQTGPDALALGLCLLLLLALVAWISRYITRRIPRIILLILLIASSGAILLATAQMQDVPLTLAEDEESFSEARLSALRAEGIPVFVNATANWCITCKVNERVALSTQSVRRHFVQRGIRVLVADWTRRDPSIAEYLKQFGRNGVPTYVYYPPQGAPVLLPQLLTAERVMDATR